MLPEIDPATQTALNHIHRLVDDGLIAWPHFDYLAVAPAEFDASTWFESNPQALEGHRFIEFGRDGTGSAYCLWYHPKLEGRPPVVFWGSEGDYEFVADQADDFARQLSSGEVPWQGRWMPAEADSGALPDFAALRKRTEGCLGVWSETAEELRTKGVARHPDFVAWVAAIWQ